MQGREKKEKNKNNSQTNTRYFTVDEVSQHADKENGIWVTYKDGVYDVTDFVAEHPGGDNIMLAAGSAVDPFWMIYSAHKQPEILKMLEKYKIGSLSLEESKASVANMDDPYLNDPKRNPIFRINAKKPFNAEPPLPILVDSFITPSEIFYVRNHLPVPEVDIESYELEISGLNVKERTFTLDELKNKFPIVTITATIQCAGNRRNEMSKVKPVKGLGWDAGAIGNATWTGVRLIDVLKACGFENGDGVEHIQFEGLDTDPTNNPYGASIPIDKVLDRSGDVLLAFEMNGRPLTRDHGYPLRVIVPGVTGARNVKWLGRIVLSKNESPSFWQQNDYKAFSPSVDWDTVDFTSSPSIQETPVVAAICDPIGGQKMKIRDGAIPVKGYAWSGGGRKIIRVDVSADQGKTWRVAKITDEDKNAKLTRCWAWALWQIDIPIEKDQHEVELWVKAVDSSYNSQPETFENIWNLRGLVGNAYHRIKVNVLQ